MSSFDAVSQEWLIRFLEHRIGDQRIIRLIQKWLKAGILEDGAVKISDRGTGQGSVISPLLANVYLHYVFDLWAEQWRRREVRGDMIVTRYADDIVIGFEHENDARRFLESMRARFEKFGLTPHPEKTRLIEFGRYAAHNRAQRGLGKPETFTFLGFTLICGKSRRDKFLLKRKSRSDRMRAKLKEIKGELPRRARRWKRWLIAWTSGGSWWPCTAKSREVASSRPGWSARFCWSSRWPTTRSSTNQTRRSSIPPGPGDQPEDASALEALERLYTRTALVRSGRHPEEEGGAGPL